MNPYNFETDTQRAWDWFMKRVYADFTESQVGRDIQGGWSCAFVSWSRPEMTRDQKRTAEMLLRREIYKMKMGHYRCLGGWSESEGKIKQPGEVIDNLEKNGEFAVWVTDISLENAMKLAMTEHEIHGVNSGPPDFIFYRDKEQMCFVSTNPDYAPVGSKTLVFRCREGRDPFPAAEKAIARYFAQLRWGKETPSGPDRRADLEQGGQTGRE